MNENREHIETQVDAIVHLANTIGFALKYLGNGDAMTPMGAIEALGLAVKEGLSEVGTALSEVATSLDEIADSNHGIAQEIEKYVKLTNQIHFGAD